MNITFDITGTNDDGSWRINGLCGPDVSHSGGLHIYVEPGEVARVLDCETSAEVFVLGVSERNPKGLPVGRTAPRKRTIARLAQAFADFTGQPVEVCDERVSLSGKGDVYVPKCAKTAAIASEPAAPVAEVGDRVTAETPDGDVHEGTVTERAVHSDRIVYTIDFLGQCNLIVSTNDYKITLVERAQPERPWPTTPVAAAVYAIVNATTTRAALAALTDLDTDQLRQVAADCGVTLQSGPVARCELAIQLVSHVVTPRLRTAPIVSRTAVRAASRKAARV